MKKNLLLLFAGILFFQISFGQSTIAKLKFEEAEEAFNNKDYTTVLAKLDEAEEILGKTNPPMLYLRILAQNNSIALHEDIDTEEIALLRNNCAFYLLNYEHIDGLEEKYREVYLVSEGLSQYEYYADYLKAQQYYKARNYELALPLYKKVASSGYAKAMTDLGIFYNTGECGVSRDDNKAFEYFQKASEKGNKDGMFQLAKLYYNGLGTERDYKKALEWFLKAAENGEENSMNYIGLIYLNGFGVNKDPNKAQEWFKKAFDNGVVWGGYKIGWMYYHGIGVTQDYNIALKWFFIGAEKNYIPSIEGVADSYRFGLFSYTKAMEWYNKAIDNGSIYAITAIGYLYFEGLGVKKDYAKAFEYYLKAAEKGNSDAMYYLGSIYEFGHGKKINYTEAVTYYYKAAENGHAGAMFKIGFNFQFGDMLKKDHIEAFKWYTKAAENGSVGSIFRIGQMYHYGDGVQKDKILAREWYDKYIAAGGSSNSRF